MIHLLISYLNLSKSNPTDSYMRLILHFIINNCSIVAGATATTRQKISSTFKCTSSSDLSSDSLSSAAQKVTERMTQNVNGKTIDIKSIYHHIFKFMLMILWVM